MRKTKQNSTNIVLPAKADYLGYCPCFQGKVVDVEDVSKVLAFIRDPISNDSAWVKRSDIKFK
jgi:hypothetical protein